MTVRRPRPLNVAGVRPVCSEVSRGQAGSAIVALRGRLT
jgi:hypothetical protein